MKGQLFTISDRRTIRCGMAMLYSVPFYVLTWMLLSQSAVVPARHITSHHKELTKRSYIDSALSHQTNTASAVKRFVARAGSFRINDAGVIGAGIYQINQDGAVNVDIKLHINSQTQDNTLCPVNCPNCTAQPCPKPTSPSTTSSTKTTPVSTPASTTASNGTTLSSTTTKSSSSTTPAATTPSATTPSATTPSTTGAYSRPTNAASATKATTTKSSTGGTGTTPSGLGTQPSPSSPSSFNSPLELSSSEDSVKSATNDHDNSIESSSGTSLKLTPKSIEIPINDYIHSPEDNNPEDVFKNPQVIEDASNKDDVVKETAPGKAAEPYAVAAQNVNMQATNTVSTPNVVPAQPPLHASPIPELNKLKEALSEAASNWVFNIKDGRPSPYAYAQQAVHAQQAAAAQQQQPPVTYVHQGFAPDRI